MTIPALDENLLPETVTIYKGDYPDALEPRWESAPIEMAAYIEQRTARAEAEATGDQDEAHAWMLCGPLTGALELAIGDKVVWTVQARTYLVSAVETLRDGATVHHYEADLRELSV